MWQNITPISNNGVHLGACFNFDATCERYCVCKHRESIAGNLTSTRPLVSSCACVRVRASASAERARPAWASRSPNGPSPHLDRTHSETDFTFAGRADERLRRTTHTYSPAEFAGASGLADCQMSGVPYSCVEGPDGRYKIPLANLRSRRTHQAVAEQCSGFWYVINSLYLTSFPI